jgi:hypothetical protein
MIFFYSGESPKDDAYEAGGKVPRATLLSFFNMTTNTSNTEQLASILQERKSEIDCSDFLSNKKRKKKNDTQSSS